jgi:hypothetical protein
VFLVRAHPKTTVFLLKNWYDTNFKAVGLLPKIAFASETTCFGTKLILKETKRIANGTYKIRAD